MTATLSARVADAAKVLAETRRPGYRTRHQLTEDVGNLQAALEWMIEVAGELSADREAMDRYRQAMQQSPWRAT